MICFKSSALLKPLRVSAYIFTLFFVLTVILVPSSKTLLAKEKDKKSHLPEGLQGNWRGSRLKSDQTNLSQEELDRLSQLMALPYAQGVQKKPKMKEVTKYDKKAAWEGVNFYVSGHGPEAFLIDMNGKILHKWRYDITGVWPRHKKTRGGSYWRKGHLYPNGDILAIFEGIGIIKINKRSELLWSYKGRSHHDVYVDAKGLIYVLTRKPRIVQRINPEANILDDAITILSPGGKVITSFSLIDCFYNSPYEHYIDNMWKKKGDVLHTNAIEIFDGSQEHRSEIFKKGNALVSSRYLSVIAIVDMTKKSIVWAEDGFERKLQWNGQHDPTLLANGRLLLFDNRGYRGRSKIIEFDPLSKKIFWEYYGTSANEFYSRGCGTSYRLANGNTLIIESDAGRAFEVTQDKKIVWEFYNPHFAGENDEFIAILPDMVRIDKKYIKGLDLE